jgi:hypothetical protein
MDSCACGRELMFRRGAGTVVRSGNRSSRFSPSPIPARGVESEGETSFRSSPHGRAASPSEVPGDDRSGECREDGYGDRGGWEENEGYGHADSGYRAGCRERDSHQSCFLSTTWHVADVGKRPYGSLTLATDSGKIKMSVVTDAESVASAAGPRLSGVLSSRRRLASPPHLVVEDTPARNL